MLVTFDAALKLIESGKILHIAGTESLLKKLPKGKWIGGSTEYFMDKDGGRVSGDLLFVDEFSYSEFSIKSYTTQDIGNITKDTFGKGFSIVIMPFASEVAKEYAQNAAGYENMFLSNIVGWVSGKNLNAPDQTPIVVNGGTGEVFTDRAVVLHLGVPKDKTVVVGIVNIFEQDTSLPVIEFKEEVFSVKKCFIDGKEVVLANYIKENNIDTKSPLVGDYSGYGLNVAFKSIEGDVVTFYAPVFSGVKYRMAKFVPNYVDLFNKYIAEHQSYATASMFSCSCVLNFLYGALEGKQVQAFSGPVTFGEIAYQLVSQTLVYVSVS
jgi:hypothetical protein